MISIYLTNGDFILNKEIDKETSKSIYFTTLYGYKCRYDQKSNKLYNLTTQCCLDVAKIIKN